ncbi:uncharacterized protein N7511_008288 [Penicillium nucicola]|uniref:uncharacterized protein n=1 Tax=Penicillium nucicola TaxID=1850975 RepID=UPI0025456234|nr:uncharacterized protein N7511_008288 [Penicillium nucicola]KAJ5754135.1 hypothetical protein N7511_008288 [Penicillium nucicola]
MDCGSQPDITSTRQPQAFSSLSRLFSQPSTLERVAQDSQGYTGISRLEEFAAFSDPILVLSNLMDTLREHRIPGPRLLRLKREFNVPLGHGAQSEIFGFDCSVLTVSGLDAWDGRLPTVIRKLNTIAVKRSRVVVSGKKGITNNTSTSSEEFVFQCAAAHREIDVLCHQPLRKHPNIVRLVAWGLCLDSLEDSDDEVPRVPLLILERASCSLAAFLGNKFMYRRYFDFYDVCELLLDIGHGLEAIHQHGFAHGDLKPDNILLFEKYGEWSAKLCDFGLSTSDASYSNGKMEYRGTPGWRAPEFHRQSWAPLDLRGHQRCDVFAFGLVVWSTFTHGRAPLQPHMESIGDALQQATIDLTAHRGLSIQQCDRIVVTLQSALMKDPEARQNRPWRYLDAIAYKRVGKQVRLWRSLVKKTRKMRYAVRDYQIPSINLLRSSLKPLNWQQYGIFWGSLWKGKEIEEDRLLPPEINSQLSTLFERLGLSFMDSTDPEAVSQMKHSRQPCMSLSKLCMIYDGLLECIQTRDEVRLYAFARLRSRLPVCCWRQLVMPVNVIDRYIQGPHQFVTLAWLCRGEVGACELNDPEYTESIIRCVLQPPQNFSYFAVRRDQLSTQQRSNHFMVLLEHGIRIEHVGKPDGLTAFLRYLQLSNQFSRSGYGNLSVIDICINFKRIAQKQCIQASTRFYMTGALPDREESTTGYSNTALHDSVIAGNYLAVETLVRSGFVVNALNGESKTALYLALQQQKNQQEQKMLSRTSEQPDSTALFRIIALLRQNSGYEIEMTTLAWKGKDMPLGWQRLPLVPLVPNSSVGSIDVYHDILSESFTFHLPKFSIFEDRRLALGMRRFSTYGQTYYLDLFRFISPSHAELVTENLISEIEIYDDVWFQSEPSLAGVAFSLEPRTSLTKRNLASVRRKRQQIHRRKFSLRWIIDYLKLS